MRAVILIAALLACGGNFVEAQSSRRINARHGLWVGFGLGQGSSGLSCTSCVNDRFGGFSDYFRVGATLSRSVLLGIESNGWLHSDGGVDETIGFASAVLLWYPAPTGALYVKFGLGAMSYRADDGFDELTATAPSASIGVGYEFRMGRKASLVPYVNYLTTSSVGMRFNGTPVALGEDVRFNLFQFGLGVTFH
jgi:hypothetical protein